MRGSGLNSIAQHTCFYHGVPLCGFFFSFLFFSQWDACQELEEAWSLLLTPSRSVIVGTEVHTNVNMNVGDKVLVGFAVPSGFGFFFKGRSNRSGLHPLPGTG